MKYVIVSERWSQDATEATYTEIQAQATIYEHDRAGNLGHEDDTPVSVRETTRNGRPVVIDETGEVIAVTVAEYREAI